MSLNDLRLQNVLCILLNPEHSVKPNYLWKEILKSGGGVIWGRFSFESQVIPAKAGIQPLYHGSPSGFVVDSRFSRYPVGTGRGNDGN